MVVAKTFRKFLYAGVALILWLPVSCPAGDSAGAVVIIEDLPVYAKASLESPVVARIARGETVAVTIEMLGTGADGPWCGIAPTDTAVAAGFVQCQHLEVGRGREEWQLLGATAPPQKAPAATPVIIRGNQVLVPVVLRNGQNEEEALLVLDTGASRTSIHSEVASRLKINMRKTVEGMSRIADGSLDPIRSTKIKGLKVGPHSRENLEISIRKYKDPESDHDGLLGMDVLRDLHYRIDFEKQQIVWL